jgi:predicted nicotinamide N-methyase
MLDASESREQRVAVLGTGSCIPALALAKAGAHVVWAERIERLAETGRELVSRNRLSKRLCVPIPRDRAAAQRVPVPPSRIV